jgi:hypothetical protein
MIKFFRKIRQNLIMENKTSKYFKYAIGEIVLVVIGILIALQINNWNEDRKIKVNEQAYLTNMIKDVKEDIAFNGRNILSRYDKKVEALQQGKAYYQGTYQIQDTLVFLNELGYGAVFGNVIWAFKKTTYNQLLNTGDFKAIANDSLRESILNYYNLLNTIEESSEGKKTGYVKYTNSLAPFNKEDPDFISKFDQRLFLSKTKTEEFYRLLNLELNLAYDIKSKSLAVNERAEKLIKLIESHLEK